MANDDWYSTIKADTGTEVSGGAALLVRIKRGGGMSRVAQRIGERAAQQMLDEINEGEFKRAPLRLVTKKVA
ncbi:hypothetical protein ACIPLR_25565 [Herbaspirillum huttiense]|uniref:hypothetical protein n=1 Tax=Herbaspirillum huttiense TaxID=863372 RepID=UPI0037F921DC